MRAVAQIQVPSLHLSAAPSLVFSKPKSKSIFTIQQNRPFSYLRGMQAAWQDIIEDTTGRILQKSVLSGGDTSSVYRLQTTSGQVVVKTNSNSATPTLLKAEYLGLQALAATRTVWTPQILLHHQDNRGELLAMEYLPNGPKSAAIMQDFGRQLAELHLVTQSTFGWQENNYIGRLPQSNEQQENWTTFYLSERLLPQIKQAVDGGHLSTSDAPKEERLDSGCAQLLGDPVASPLHGDLWNGNYLPAANNKVYLIDPSFYYGHAEVDLAMSRLFGGFGSAFYRGYSGVLPAEPGSAERQDIYQLYYLLVHLNMFGNSYLSGVNRIMRRYFY